MPEEQTSSIFDKKEKKSGNGLRIIGIIIAAIIIGLLVWFFVTQSKPYKMVYSDTNGQKVYLVYMNKNKVNAKNVDKIIKDVKAKAAILEKKDAGKANFMVAVKVYDDQSYVVIDPKAQAQKVKDQASMKPEEKALAFQKQFEAELDHLVLTSNNRNAWKITYGPKFQSLKK